ncbi:hypothetical protein ABLO16_04685 [Mycobacterium tuberculosis]
MSFEECWHPGTAAVAGTSGLPGAASGLQHTLISQLDARLARKNRAALGAARWPNRLRMPASL